MQNMIKNIDVVVQEGLSNHLKVSGYRRKGRTFYKSCQDCTKILNIQSSKTNSVSAASFTLNLGIYFPAVEEKMLRPYTVKAIPKEYECTMRTRIGILMPDRLDKWWHIDESTNLDELCTELSSAWTNHAKPWLETNSILLNAKQYLLSKANRQDVDILVASAICLVLKEESEAADLLAKATTKTTPLSKRRIIDWGENNGLRVLPER